MTLEAYRTFKLQAKALQPMQSPGAADGLRPAGRPNSYLICCVDGAGENLLPICMYIVPCGSLK